MLNIEQINNMAATISGELGKQPATDAIKRAQTASDYLLFCISRIITETEHKENTLTVLERSNGFYSGYEYVNERFEQVFNTNVSSLLFSFIKHYTDIGYSIKMLDKSQESDFMDGRSVFAQPEAASDIHKTTA